MPVIASQLVSKVAVEGDTEAKAKLSAYSKKVDEANATAGKIGDTLKMGLMVGGGALLALGATATKMAGDYNAGLTSLVTGAGELPKNLGLVHNQMLQISTDTGTMTDQLIAGEYMINSAGQKGATSLNTLKMAAEGAKVGSADLGTVADATTTIMTDFAKQHITAAQAVNTLIATVSDGKTHMADLAGSFATILPIASAFGLHLQDITGAMATMTGEGVPAADAATYLRQTIASLESPGSKAVSVLKEIGLTSAQISDSMKRSVPDTLQLIEDHLAKKFPVGSAAYMNALKDIAGGTKTFQGMLDLTGAHLDTFKSNVIDITSKVKQGGDSIVGWSLVQHDFNQQLDETHAAFDAMLIKLGEELIPIVSKFLTDDVMPAINHFQEWEQQTHGLENAFQSIVGVLGTVITDTEAVVSWFGKAGPQGDILKTVALGLGVAIATIKIGNIVSDMANFVQAVPGLLVKMGLVETAAEGISGSKDATKGLAGIAPAAKTAEGELASGFGKNSAAQLSLLGVASIVAGIVVGLEQIGEHIPDVQNAWNPQGGNVSNNNLSEGPHSMGQMTRDLFKPGAVWGPSATDTTNAANLKQQMQDIDQAWADMNRLADQFNGKRLLGILDDPVGGITAVDVKVMDLKTHLDDTSMPTIIGVLSKDAETADNKIRVLKSSLDDITKQPFDLHMHFDPKDIAAMMSFKSQLDDPTVPPVPTGNLPGHASGILNSPFGHWAMVGERGPEPMYIPQGASVLPSGSAVPSGNTQQAPVYLQIDGQTFARLMLPYMAGNLRTGIGMVGV